MANSSFLVLHSSFYEYHYRIILFTQVEQWGKSWIVFSFGMLVQPRLNISGPDERSELTLHIARSGMEWQKTIDIILQTVFFPTHADSAGGFIINAIYTLRQFVDT